MEEKDKEFQRDQRQFQTEIDIKSSKITTDNKAKF